MLHCFRALGVNIALDVLSGAVHVLDDMAFEASRNAEDIYAEAQQINEERAAGEQVIGDEEQADGAETAEEPAETSGE